MRERLSDTIEMLAISVKIIKSAGMPLYLLRIEWLSAGTAITCSKIQIRVRLWLTLAGYFAGLDVSSLSQEGGSS